MIVFCEKRFFHPVRPVDYFNNLNTNLITLERGIVVRPELANPAAIFSVRGVRIPTSDSSTAAEKGYQNYQCANARRTVAPEHEDSSLGWHLLFGHNTSGVWRSLVVSVPTWEVVIFDAAHGFSEI